MKTNPDATVIALRGLKKRYGIGDAEHTVLDGVDLVIEKGEFIAIMGPSGCGKTTLLNILGLLDRADDGDYFLADRSVESLSARRHANIRSEQIGFVFQNFNLVPRLNVIENVALPLIYKGIRKTKRLQLASKILQTFHLSEREYYMPWQLSGGQTQRVAIARALVNSPSIVLADEPTGMLDGKIDSDTKTLQPTVKVDTTKKRLDTHAAEAPKEKILRSRRPTKRKTIKKGVSK